MKLAMALLAATVLPACIYVPRTTEVYDEKCQVYARQMTLHPEQIAYLGHCSGRECVYALVTFGAVAAASAVVSGSIVVAGNIAYWFEKQGKCALA